MRRPAPVAGAPLLDHPVVVGLHAEERELLVLALVERLAAEAGERVREADRRLDVVGRHVEQPVLLDPAAGADLVVGDRRDVELLEVERRAQLGERVDEVVVEPPVAHLAALDALLVGEDAALEVELRGVADHPGAAVEELLRQPVGPEGGRLHHVVVDGDDQRQIGGISGVSHAPDTRTCSSSGTAGLRTPLEQRQQIRRTLEHVVAGQAASQCPRVPSRPGRRARRRAPRRHGRGRCRPRRSLDPA